MRVFVTGASGWIGSAVLPEIVDKGHSVVGLARSDASAARLRSLGADVLRGDLDELDKLRAGADAADGVIHLAFKHDIAFSRDGMAVAAASDRAAIDAFGEALAGSGRALVIASGTPFVPGRVATERDEPPTTGPAAARGANAKLAASLADRGVRSAVVRLPRSVHGAGDRGFIAQLVSIAREKGVSGYVADGSSRWPAVHVLDAASLFRLALEGAPAGSVLHGVGDQGVPTRNIAAVIGRHLDVPVASVPAEHFGFLGMVLAGDQPAASSVAADVLGWRATHPGLIEDMEAGHYFLRSGDPVRR